MPVTGAERCPQCGSELPNLPPEGLCPACLLKEVLAGEVEPAAEESPEEDGQRYGPYTTVRILGEDGMGIVYLARQGQPLHRTVALKVIKPGMDSRQVIARFESERQALALMDHSNIARVFDAGAAEDGRPYFATECGGDSPAGILRCEPVEQRAAAGVVSRDLSGHPPRAPKRDHPPRSQAVQRAGRGAGRQGGSEGDRFRNREGSPSAGSPSAPCSRRQAC